MNTNTICALIVFYTLVVPSVVTSQVTMDMEVLGGVTLNGKNNNYSDETYSFELKNGFSYGLGFDIWLPKDYGISFGFRHSKSTARNTLNYPDGFMVSSHSFSSGKLEDRIFYFGMKKRFFIDAHQSLCFTPHLGFSYNPFIFDNEDMSYIESFEFDNYTQVESRSTYSRFHSSNVGKSQGYLGSFGGRLGVGIEKNIPNVGTFSLSAIYTVDLRKSVDRNLYVYQFSTVSDNSTGAQQTFFYQNDDSRNISRNFLLIELGFKMPGSILLSKGKGSN